MANAEVGQYNKKTSGAERAGESQRPVGDVYADTRGISRQEYQGRYFFTQKNYDLTDKISAGDYGVNKRTDDTPMIGEFKDDPNVFRQGNR